MLPQLLELAIMLYIYGISPKWFFSLVAFSTLFLVFVQLRETPLYIGHHHRTRPNCRPSSFRRHKHCRPIRPGPTSLQYAKNAALVVASTSNDDTSWLPKSFPQFERHIYTVDDPDAKLTVPENKGHEAMVYLTYIVDNYENLPPYIFFLHSSRYQWHNDDPDYDGLQLLRRFQLPYLEEMGYVSLRCDWLLGCPPSLRPLEQARPKDQNRFNAYHVYKDAFEELFPGVRVPKLIGGGCCAQFAVTRDQIYRRPKSQYEHYRQWLLQTELHDDLSGRIFEYSWHLIFGQPPVNCPNAEECYCNVFGLCNLKCDSEATCQGRYSMPDMSLLPVGWPHKGWIGEPRNRSDPEVIWSGP